MFHQNGHGDAAACRPLGGPDSCPVSPFFGRNAIQLHMRCLRGRRQYRSVKPINPFINIDLHRKLDGFSDDLFGEFLPLAPKSASQVTPSCAKTRPF